MYVLIKYYHDLHATSQNWKPCLSEPFCYPNYGSNVWINRIFNTISDISKEGVGRGRLLPFLRPVISLFYFYVLYRLMNVVAMDGINQPLSRMWKQLPSIESIYMYCASWQSHDVSLKLTLAQEVVEIIYKE